jgi:hypothetical protein
VFAPLAVPLIAPVPEASSPSASIVFGEPLSAAAIAPAECVALLMLCRMEVCGDAVRGLRGDGHDVSLTPLCPTTVPFELVRIGLTAFEMLPLIMPFEIGGVRCCCCAATDGELVTFALRNGEDSGR